MSEEKAELSAVPMTEEEKQAGEKQAAIDGTEKSVLMLKRNHDLLQVGLFQGANGAHVAEVARFVKHLIVQAEAEVKSLKGESEPVPAPVVQLDQQGTEA